MRQVGSIAHNKFKIVVYATEQYFYVEAEAGPMKQCFKFLKDDVTNLGELEMLFTTKFKDDIYETFNSMFVNYQAALKASK
jgi:hypothetical protein